MEPLEQKLTELSTEVKAFAAKAQEEVKNLGAVQTETKTAVNRNNRTRVRSSLRALREAIAKGDVKAAQAQFRETVSALDKSVQKGVLHSNTVSRYKSRLNARLKALSTAKA